MTKEKLKIKEKFQMEKKLKTKKVFEIENLKIFGQL